MSKYDPEIDELRNELATLRALYERALKELRLYQSHYERPTEEE